MASTLNASNSGAGGLISTADASGVLQLQTAGTTAVTIDTSQNVTTVGNTSLANSSGNVGIGGASVASGEGKLNIASSTSPASLHLFYGTNGDNYLTCGSSGIQVFRTGSTERMRIASNGYVMMNSTSYTLASADNQLSIKCSDMAGVAYGIGIQNVTNNSGGRFINFINSSNTTNGYISQTNSTTVAYTTSSDYRLKENVQPLQNALNRISLLKPVTFTWKDSNDVGEGFIAHELAEIIPDAVCGNKDDVNEDGSIKAQGVDTSFLVATLTAAIQEQQTIINDLKARIETLEAK
jgi:hypothetical protein